MSLKHMLCRLRSRLPLDSLALYIGVDRRSLSRWLAGSTQPLPVYRPIIIDLHDKAFPKKNIKRGPSPVRPPAPPTT